MPGKRVEIFIIAAAVVPILIEVTRNSSIYGCMGFSNRGHTMFDLNDHKKLSSFIVNVVI